MNKFKLFFVFFAIMAVGCTGFDNNHQTVAPYWNIIDGVLFSDGYIHPSIYTVGIYVYSMNVDISTNNEKVTISGNESILIGNGYTWFDINCLLLSPGDSFSVYINDDIRKYSIK